MLIKEQIKIARMIASGTPRELAINEVAVTSSIEKSGPTIDVKNLNDEPKSAQQQSVEKDRKRKAIQKGKHHHIQN